MKYGREIINAKPDTLTIFMEKMNIVASTVSELTKKREKFSGISFYSANLKTTGNTTYQKAEDR